VKLQRYSVDTRFERAYLSVRSDEGRVYTLEQIKRLPETDSKDPNAEEWKLRAKSTRKFLTYLKSLNKVSCLDLGCGNGWMINRMLPFLENVVGVDVNNHELEQAAEIFENEEHVSLIYGDIFSIELKQRFDIVLIYAAVQYFPNFDNLVKRLADFLKPNGSIHILDSPFYPASLVESAKKRSTDYYQSKNNPEMATFYHHHTLESLEKYGAIFHYRPNSFIAKLKRMFSTDSPFPWIEIKRASIA